MQALILAGGEGTRLRPLTSTLPKPIVPLCNRPFISYMLDWLRGHGVDEVIMSCGFLATGLRAVLGDGSGAGVALRYVEEERPLGTAGAVKYAERFLDGRFLVLNGDVLTDLDLGLLLDLHERSGARATISLTPVSDPSAYGLVRTREDGEITEFLEKPSPDQIDTDLINAGAYVLEREVLDAVAPGEPCSFERDVFPALVGKGLYGARTPGYWLDIGTPQRYLQATFDILERNVATAVGAAMDERYLGLEPEVEVADGARVVPPAIVASGSSVAAGARVGSLAVVGAGSHIGAGALVERAVLHQSTELAADVVVRDSIVAAGVKIGPGARLEGAVVGEGAVIGAGNVLSHGMRLFPAVELPDGAVGF